ncbi:hypothetical protein FBU30_006437 [Linnemannia zychae]|nr:hypothetical protein FBU30_006437 [Linnemannia zychae]
MLRFLSGKFKPVNQEFNVWDYALPEIYGIILAMFVKLDLVKCLNITEGELLDFIIDVDRGYLATYYHSFFHAADVTAVLYHILLDMNASQYLSKPDMAALLLAGLCHDIGHPGLNNLFQVNAKTELVAKFGETSVLEKYSCSLAMDLVDKHKLFRNISSSPAGILPEGSFATEQSMKESMVKAIMATDMSFHYDMLNNLNSLIEFTSTPSCSPSSSDIEAESDSDADSTPSPTDMITSTTESTATVIRGSLQARLEGSICHHSHSHRRQSSSSSTSSDCSDISVASETSSQTSRSINGPNYRSASDLTPELRQNLINCLLHAADISNAVKPWHLCKRWSDLVIQEFFRQGDIEKAQSLPVSPNMDRDLYSQPQISLGFADFVVLPYFESFVEFLPEAAPFLAALISNREQWVLMQKASLEVEKEHASACATEAGNTATATATAVVAKGESDVHVGANILAEHAAEVIEGHPRPSSPFPAHLSPGRRVSVAAGVLVVDETRPLRPPPRRLRHATNTDMTQGHILRKMKRSHSGRMLSSCLRDHLRPTQPVRKVNTISQEAIVSALKRELSLAGKECCVNLTYLSSGDSLSGPDAGPTTATVGEAAKLSNIFGSSLPMYPENNMPHPPSPQPSEYRRRRHGSLQIETHYPRIRHELGTGYINFDDEDRLFAQLWEHRDRDEQHETKDRHVEHIPSTTLSAFPNSRHALPPPYSYPHPHQPFTASTTPQLTSTGKVAAASVSNSVKPMTTPERAMSFQPGESLPQISTTTDSASSNNKRSSAPVISQFRYDWSQPLLEQPLPKERCANNKCGPLDRAIESCEGFVPIAAAASIPILTTVGLCPCLSIQTAIMSAAVATSVTRKASNLNSDPVVTDKPMHPRNSIELTMTESVEGPMGCVVGQTMGQSATGESPASATIAQKPSDNSGVVSLSAVASSSASPPALTTATTTTGTRMNYT